ncbi:MAG TPA: hypothetical protein VD814_00090 [Nocardioides sp.]|nr:hypothetical protein [Nocardioides sp.]
MGLTAAATVAAVVGLSTPASADHDYEGPASGSAGDPTIVVPVNDSAAGGTYYQPFTRAYAGTTSDGTPVYIYVPQGTPLNGDAPEGVHSMDPSFDHAADDEFVPCGEGVEDYTLTQAQIDYLGDQLTDQIVRVDEEHFGPMDAADPSDPSSDSLVTLVYNVQDESYYDCAVTTYTAGYFAPDFMDSLGMNVITLDAFDWANRVGSDPSTAPWGDDDPENDSPELYEGVIAHELEHLLMNYSDPGELSWVDEGLADMAAFLNGYDMTGSHLTYQQVFHRETSLTRWGGGLENYGASFSYFAYLWEQAGGNGGGDLTPDLEYDGTAGDLLIKMIFEEQDNGMGGVQRAIDEYNAATGDDLGTARQLFEDWAVTMQLDDEASDRWDLENFDLGPASGGWTIDLANSQYWDDRGFYQGAQPDPKFTTDPHRPATNALPFGVSYETFRNPGPRVQLEFHGDPISRVAPHSEPTHWWGGAESQSDYVLGVDSAVSGGQTLGFWNWHFIEDGWDFGFVEALVGGEWVTVPVTDDAGNVVSTNEDPHGNNTEGNGITGTSGGEYFVDEPTYQHYNAELPVGTSDVRFRYSTDAAYLDTGWFIDDVTVNGSPAVVSGEGEQPWIETDGIQDNVWSVQLISSCDLTPGRTTRGELVDDAGNFVYRFRGADITSGVLNTKCANGRKADFVLVVSNMPTADEEGDLDTLDAAYDYRVTKVRRGR